MGQSQAVSRDEKPNGRQDPCLRTREPPLDLANDQLAKLEDTFPRLIPSLERSYLNEIRSAWRLRPWAPLLLAATSITDAPRLLAITRIRERLRPYLGQPEVVSPRRHIAMPWATLHSCMREDRRPPHRGRGQAASRARSCPSR